MREMKKIRIENYKNKKYCPLIKREYRECYCNNLTSRNISLATYYCSKNFKQCSIYKKYCNLKKQKMTLRV